MKGFYKRFIFYVIFVSSFSFFDFKNNLNILTAQDFSESENNSINSNSLQNSNSSNQVRKSGNVELKNLIEKSPGLKLFMQNKPSEAIPVLESELSSQNANLELFNYLGIAYMQVENFSKAAATFERGISVFGTNKKILYFNQGNAYFKMNNFNAAADSFSMAIVADSNFAESYLNRANSYLQLNEIENSIADYEKFMQLNPNDEQNEKIKFLIESLKQEQEIRIVQEEKRKAEELRLRQEEERLLAAKAEQERIEQERKAQEAERRRKLLEDVAASLQNSSDTTNMSAGAEEVFNYDTESELE